MAPDTLIATIPDMEREAEEHERRAEALRAIIGGLRALYPEQASVPTVKEINGHAQDGLRGRTAVRAIMRSRPGAWTIQEIVYENRRRNWPSSKKALENAVHRAHEAGELVKVKAGVYRLAEEGVIS